MITLFLSVTALADKTRPFCKVAMSPIVIAAEVVITVPINALFAPKVVGAVGTQNTFDADAPPLSATIELAEVSRVELVRKIYRPGPFIVKVPVIVIEPA